MGSSSDAVRISGSVFRCLRLATTYTVMPRIRRKGEIIKHRNIPRTYWKLSEGYSSWFARNSPLKTKTIGAKTIKSPPFRLVKIDFLGGIAKEVNCIYFHDDSLILRLKGHARFSSSTPKPLCDAFVSTCRQGREMSEYLKNHTKTNIFQIALYLASEQDALLPGMRRRNAVRGSHQTLRLQKLRFVRDTAGTHGTAGETATQHGNS